MQPSLRGSEAPASFDHAVLAIDPRHIDCLLRIHAEIALPPERSMSMAASVASGWEVAAIASMARTGERPEN